MAETWVDAGATTPERAAALARAGAARNVVGTESLGAERGDGRLGSPLRRRWCSALICAADG